MRAIFFYKNAFIRKIIRTFAPRKEEIPKVDHENFRYIGIYFNINVVNDLKNYALQYIRKLGWTSYYILGDHITVANKEDATPKILKWADLHIDQEVEFTITKIGWSDRVIAFQVDSLFPSAYNIKHLTLAMNTAHTDVKSGNARDITNWTDFDNITLKGFVNYIR